MDNNQKKLPTKRTSKSSNKETVENAKDNSSILTSNQKQSQNASSTNTNVKERHDIEIQCDLEDDIESLIELSEEELLVKEKNPDTYLRLIAEKLRVELFDHLQENMELHKMKEELKDEHQQLIEEKSRLLNLVEEANDIVNNYNELRSSSTVNDSGLN